MSSNDLIILSKERAGYVLKHKDIEGGTYSRKVYKGLLTALRGAERLQNEVDPEYGIYLRIQNE